MTKCLYCNDNIEPNSPKKFCNRSCSASYNNRLVPKKKRTATKTTNCVYCNASFTYKLSQSKGKFCSTKCCGDFKTKTSKQLFYEGKLTDGGTLRATMLKIFEQKCSVCNLTEWFGKPMPVWIDHIDGCAANNHPTNLRLICPNCDSFNQTFGGRNRGKGRKVLGLKK